MLLSKCTDVFYTSHCMLAKKLFCFFMQLDALKFNVLQVGYYSSDGFFETE